MRICRMAIKNFANFDSVEFETDESIVIVGENKVGKSNLLRALRLVLDPSLSDRERQLGMEHFWDGLGGDKLGAEVSIAVDFTDFDDDNDLLAVLGDSLVDTDEPVVARLTYLYRPKASLNGAKPHSLADYEFLVFGGTNEDNLFTSSQRRELPMDYLFALRDAEGDLLNWRRSPLRPIVEELTESLGEEARAELQVLINKAHKGLAEREEVSTAAQKVSQRLKEMVGPAHAVPLSLGVAPTDVDVMLRSLRLLIDGGTRGIADASLGTANLLFLTLKGLELDRAVAAGERSHTFLAIEEPEAHLHPHVQRLVYRHYLRKDEPVNATTILTTHSPHIASVAPLRSIVLLRDTSEGSTIITSAAQVDLTDEEEDDLQRYIDVTRGELFFARGIIFVEGDAERFLVPAFAEALGIDLDALGVTVCSVAGTNFAPYIKLVGPDSLEIPFVVLTDLDPRDGSEPLALGRVSKLLLELGMDQEDLDEMEVEDAFEEGEMNGIFVNENTLETELYHSGMGKAMATVFKKSISWGGQRQAQMERWLDTTDDLDDEKLLGWISEVGKGRFAQALASDVTAKTCPVYIRNALNFVKNGFRPFEL